MIAVAKTCKECHGLKMADEFHKHPGSRLGLQPRCKPCSSEWQKAHYKRQKASDPQFLEKRREANRRNRYGLTVEEYERLTGKDECEACGSTHRLCIDHNHETGEVRGLLCNDCNIALGLLEDDLERLASLAGYIRRFK